MLATSALLPIAGRAASTIRFPGWKPPVMPSRSRKPEGVPVTSASPLESFSSRSSSSIEDLVDAAEVARLLLVGDLEQQLLGALGQLTRGSPVSLVHPGLDLLAGSEQPPQQGVLLDDLGVVLGVAGRRDLGGQLGDVELAAGILDPAVLVERLDDAELVHRLRGGVEVVDRPEDQPVLVEVEVLRLQLDLVDHPGERGLGDQHRAEDRLLGLDVLRRDLGCRCLRHCLLISLGSGSAEARRSRRREPSRRCRRRSTKPHDVPGRAGQSRVFRNLSRAES